MNCGRINCKRFAITVVAVFAFIFVYEMIFHGMILEATYKATAQLWRPEAEMQGLMPWMIAGQFIMALMFCYIFTFGYEGKGIAEGARYGLLIALLMSGPNLITYAVQPMPLSLPIKWIAGGLIEGVIAGMILAAIYKPRIE